MGKQLRISAAVVSTALTFLGLSVLAGSWQTGFIFLVSGLLHEVGHALALRLMKVRLKGFTVIPFLSFAVRYHQEDVLARLNEYKYAFGALAGPLVNLGLFVIGSFLIALGIGGQLTRQLTFTNGTLAVLNLVPIGNIDGAQVFNSLFASFSLRGQKLISAVVIITGAPVTMIVTLAGHGGLPFLILGGALVFHVYRFRPLSAGYKSEWKMTRGQAVIILACYLAIMVAGLLSELLVPFTIAPAWPPH